jgi:ABC-type transport system involved in multi-copper enzyme maturation permease subunit
MNGSTFWRVFWKEYRLQRALWLAMAALTSLLMLLIVAFISTGDRSALFYLAVGLPAFYALGCGATLFAGEHEAETYEFQRMLPAGASRVFAAKFVLALLSTAALFGLTWTLAAFLNGWQLPDAHDCALMWATVGFYGLEMFVWATLFSLLSRRVLLVAILGVAAASLSAQIMTAVVGRHSVMGMMETYMAALPLRAAVVALVALADFWLATRWFREPSQRGLRSAQPTIGADTAARAAALSDYLLKPERLRIFGRLVWQHWRQSWRMLLGVSVLFVPITALGVACLNDVLMRSGRHAAFAPEGIEVFLAVVLALAAIPLLGCFAFLADQRRQSFRFLADRGVPPKYVWLSRQLTAVGVPLLLGMALLSAAFFLLTPAFFLLTPLLPGFLQPDIQRWLDMESYASVYVFGHLILVVIGYAIFGITVGQLCSMFFRSSILAGLFSVLFTAVLAGWWVLMLFWQVNWLWSVLPIPLALLLASRLRTAGWLVERNTLRAWLLPAAVLAVPAVAILTAMPLYRIYSIPLVDPGFSPAEYVRRATPEEQATLNLYRRAHQEETPLQYEDYDLRPDRPTLALTPKEIAWVNANQETIALMMKASRGKAFPFLDHPFERQEARKLAYLLVYSAARLEDKGKLDAAFEQYLAAIRVSVQLRDCYPIEEYDYYHASDPDGIELAVYAHLPSWAARPGQTPERILAAARQIEELTANIPASGGIRVAYVCLERFLKGDLSAIKAPHKQYVPMATLLWLHLPWERQRALRLLNVLTRRQVDALLRAQRAAEHGERIEQPTDRFPLVGLGYGWYGAMEFPYALQSTIFIPPLAYDARWGEVNLVPGFTAMVTSRRAVRLVLALEAWKLQHGSLPKKLDDLVGSCLDRLPVDPYSGQPFRYFRDGLKSSLQWNQEELPAPPWHYQNYDYRGGIIAANVPFVWATGPAVRFEPADQTMPRKSILNEYRLYTVGEDRAGWHQPDWRRPQSEYDIWKAGWPFPIP